MAKARKAKRVSRKEELHDQWRGSRREDSLDLLIRQLADECRRETGSQSIVVGSETGQLIFGLRFPAFCLEYLFDSNVLPLSRMINIIGKPHSNKSAFVYEIFRWFRNRGGGGVLLENETKFAEDLCRSIMCWPSKDSYIYYPSDSMEGWQAGLLSVLTLLKKLFTGTKSEPGPGRKVPMALAVDSLSGKMSKTTIKKIVEEGYASKTHPNEALSLSKFLGMIPQEIADWPFCFLTTNHLKSKSDNRGIAIDHQPGGESVRFQETYEVRMGKQSVIDTLDHQGVVLKMKLTKSSLGQCDRWIETRCLWWHERDDSGKMRQSTVWDWNWATIRNLIIMTKNKKEIGDRIREVVDLNAVAEGGDGKAWSRQLGVSKDSAVSYSELGLLLQKNKAVLTRLRDLFGIKRRNVFNPDVDYLQQIEKVKARIKSERDGK